MKAEPFVRGLNFGEGVRWHDGRFWYSDFFKHQVSSAAPDGSTRVELQIDDRPSGLGWLPDGRLLAVAMQSQKVLRREKDGSVALHADLKGFAKFHANDMIVDARGNAYVGDFGYDLLSGAPPAPGVLALARPNGSATIVAGKLTTTPTAAALLPS
jgi:sugar lactone lactonase YvrE